MQRRVQNRTQTKCLAIIKSYFSASIGVQDVQSWRSINFPCRNVLYCVSAGQRCSWVAALDYQLKTWTFSGRVLSITNNLATVDLFLFWHKPINRTFRFLTSYWNQLEWLRWLRDHQKLEWNSLLSCKNQSEDCQGEKWLLLVQGSLD